MTGFFATEPLDGGPAFGGCAYGGSFGLDYGLRQPGALFVQSLDGCNMLVDETVVNFGKLAEPVTHLNAFPFASI